MRIFRLLVLSALLAACSLSIGKTPDPEAIPSGTIEVPGSEATGLIVELGTGQMSGVGWRYSVYPSADGWCTQLETSGVTTTGCGDLELGQDEVLGGIGTTDDLPNGTASIEGIASDEIATVWLVLDDGLRFPATLMPLEEAGLTGQAFVGILPQEETITHLLALAMSGEILETYEMP